MSKNQKIEQGKRLSHRPLSPYQTLLAEGMTPTQVDQKLSIPPAEPPSPREHPPQTPRIRRIRKK